MNYHPKRKSRPRKAVLIGAAVLAAIAVGLGAFAVTTIRRTIDEGAERSGGLIYDSAAIEGGWDNLSPEELEAAQRKSDRNGCILKISVVK